MFLVIGLVSILYPALGPLVTKIEREFNDQYKAAYRYGNPKTKGYDDGGPIQHARASTVGSGGGSGNFRLHRRN